VGVCRGRAEVSLVKPGDRVVIPTHLYCGMCFNCVRGYTAACLRVRPGGFGAAYGYAGLGPNRGVQAELLRGAAEVYVVDHVAERLDMAGSLGATPVSFGDGDPVEQIRELRRRRGLPSGEEQMDGAQKGIDAVGFQARDRADPSRENPTQVVSDLARLVNPTGHIAIAGGVGGEGPSTGAPTA
jgi:glutathione-independent formaldehyde dehydrogenase